MGKSLGYLPKDMVLEHLNAKRKGLEALEALKAQLEATHDAFWTQVYEILNIDPRGNYHLNPVTGEVTAANPPGEYLGTVPADLHEYHETQTERLRTHAKKTEDLAREIKDTFWTRVCKALNIPENGAYHYDVTTGGVFEDASEDILQEAIKKLIQAGPTPTIKRTNGTTH